MQPALAYSLLILVVAGDMGFLFGSSKCSANIDILKTQPRGEHLQTVDVVITTLLRVSSPPNAWRCRWIRVNITDEVILVSLSSLNAIKVWVALLKRNSITIRSYYHNWNTNEGQMCFNLQAADHLIHYEMLSHFAYSVLLSFCSTRGV